MESHVESEKKILFFIVFMKISSRKYRFFQKKKRGGLFSGIQQHLSALHQIFESVKSN